MKIILAFVVGVIATLGAWFGYGRTSVVPAPQSQEATQNDATTELASSAHDICNPIEDKQCPALNASDAEQEAKALGIIEKANVLDETESIPFLVVSDSRYVLMKNSSYGGGVVYRVVDLSSDEITDTFSGAKYGYADRYFYFSRVPVGSANSPAYADTIGMYVVGTPKVVYLKNSTLPANQTYDSALAASGRGGATVLASSSASITFAVYDTNGKAVGQRTFEFSQVH